MFHVKHLFNNKQCMFHVKHKKAPPIISGRFFESTAFQKTIVVKV